VRLGCLPSIEHIQNSEPPLYVNSEHMHFCYCLSNNFVAQHKIALFDAPKQVCDSRCRLQCCLCAKAGGWQGFDDCGCLRCHERAGIPFPEARMQREKAVLCVDPPLPAAPPTIWCLADHPWRGTAVAATTNDASNPNDTEKSDENLMFPTDAPRIKNKAVLFDFETLFHAPCRPGNWPYQAFEIMPDSLRPPIVPDAPPPSWFDQNAIAAAQVAAADEECITALLSTRRAFLRERVVAIVQGAVGRELDEAIMMPSVREWSAVTPEGASMLLKFDVSDVKFRTLETRRLRIAFKLYAFLSFLGE
jgi:hypothetical protein